MSDKGKDGSYDEIHEQLMEIFNGSGRNTMVIPVKHPQEQAADEEQTKQRRMESLKGFNKTPKQVKSWLDRFVIKQDEAKKVLSVAVCDHYNHIRRFLDQDGQEDFEYIKQNVMLLGPTGVGKTYLIRCLAKLIGVPFVKADATKFSATGYVGGDVEDLVRDLVKMADGDVDLAECGIIYIDEIDKIAAKMNTSGARDVSGRGVQINLLKLMESSEVNLHSQTDMMAQMESMMDMMNGGPKRKKRISTRNILFIVSGAFDKMDELVLQRLQGSRIGFGREEQLQQPDNLLAETTTADFIKYGFEPEFIGRLPVRVACQSLKADDLAHILQDSEGSILRQYERDFDGYNIDFKLTNDAVDEIARRAEKQQTGARGLLTVLEHVLRDFKFELPTIGLKSFTVDERTVNEPSAVLSELIEQYRSKEQPDTKEEVALFCDVFAEETGFKLNFNKTAIQAVQDLHLESGLSVCRICEDTFKDFPYALKLIAEHTGKTSFNVTGKMVLDPQGSLSNLVKKTFKDNK